MHLLALALFLLGADPERTTVSEVPCKTVADCWLDDHGMPVARPKSQKGKKLPRGDCGKNLLWLRNKLTCTEGKCSAENVGDKC